MATKSIGAVPSTREVFAAVFDDDAGSVFAVNLDMAATEALLDVLDGRTDPPRVRLVTPDSVLKWVRNDFVLASTAAELVEDDVLELRATEERLDNTLVVTDDAVVSVVPGGERVAGLVTTDAEFVADARERLDGVWDAAEAFPLRTPARSAVETSLGEAFGPDVESDFRTMVGTLGTARGNDGLDEVAVSLLVAAKHEELLYDISKWGEDTGVASKATFSRTKTRLEDRGLIETEKVPIDVGRPRLRLVLGDERLRAVEADELASVAEGLLSTVAA